MTPSNPANSAHPATDPVAEHCQKMLLALGEDPTREGLLETPRRYSKAMKYLTSGYTRSIQDVVGNGIFNEPARGMIIVRDIELFSMCEHHLLPFFGKAHVGYLPSGKIIGLSKIPRLVDLFSRRLQVQERLTQQVADAIQEVLAPHGVGVIIEAYHLCMMMRGVEKQSSFTTSSCLLGAFKEDPDTRKEFLQLIQRPPIHRV